MEAKEQRPNRRREQVEDEEAGQVAESLWDLRHRVAFDVKMFD